MPGRVRQEGIEYYEKQKMYRILGLLNRAKILYEKYPNPDCEFVIITPSRPLSFKNSVSNSTESNFPCLERFSNGLTPTKC